MRNLQAWHLSMALMLLPSALVACNGEPAAPLSADAAQPVADAAELGDPDASTTAACGAIAVGTSNLDPWREATVDWFRSQGYSGARSERQYGDTVTIRGFEAPVDSTELEASSLSWLLSLPDFPVSLAAEVEVSEFKRVLDNSAVVVLSRTTIGATPARLFRPLATVHLSKTGDVWSAMSITVWGSTALMGEAEALALTACSPASAPSRKLIEESAFEGLTMSACAIVGEYSYQPDRADVIEFADSIDWVVIDGNWRARRGAVLTVANDNHWSDIAGSDCYCDGVAGFELFTDAVSGEVLEYRPGIGCVVC